MSYNDPNDVESALQVPPAAPPATPALVRATPNGIASGTENPRATIIGAPATPPIATGLTRVSTNGIAAGTENPRAAAIGVPATPSIVSSATPVPQPTSPPTQPQVTRQPGIAGAQLVMPTPATTQAASQLSQTANAPQVMIATSTLTPSA